MSRIFVTGSSTGLGLLSGLRLMELGHQVIFHARNSERAGEIASQVTASEIVVGDLCSISETEQVAAQVNQLGTVDAVIHNAGVGYGAAPRRTGENVPDTYAVNVLAPYILTALVPAQRLVYLSSSMHRVAPRVEDPFWRHRSWNGSQAYSESKLYVTALALAVARLRPSIFSNAVDPGWVPTRMGGQGAPDDLNEGIETQVALAIGEVRGLSGLSGRYLHHMQVRSPAPPTQGTDLQEQVIGWAESLSGLRL